MQEIKIGHASIPEVPVFKKLETLKYPSILTQKTMCERIAHLDCDVSYLNGQKRIMYPPVFEGHIENYMGMVQVPVGLMGPILIHGQHAQGEFFVPMATTEGALVASYTRGGQVITAAGGVNVLCERDQVSRIPGFILSSPKEAKKLMAWCLTQEEEIRHKAESTSRYLCLKQFKYHTKGVYVFLEMIFTTAEASGQNMVTFAADAACKYIAAEAPVKIKNWYVESNMSGDKKPSTYNQLHGRGKKVTASITIPRQLVRKMLHCTPEDICTYGQLAAVAAKLSGAMGTQGHFANALTAIFLACGQDVACVVESVGGTSQSSLTPDRDLHCCITLPNLMVGTVGGGTGLPVQRECLDVMGCKGPYSALKLAEICGAVILAGEISIAAAMAAGHFTWAHLNYGRGKKHECHQ